jgi:hypothetical protein
VIRSTTCSFERLSDLLIIIVDSSEGICAFVCCLYDMFCRIKYSVAETLITRLPVLPHLRLASRPSCLVSSSLFALTPAILGTDPRYCRKHPGFSVPTFSHPLPCSALCDATSATLLGFNASHACFLLCASRLDFLFYLRLAHSCYCI